MLVAGDTDKNTIEKGAPKSASRGNRAKARPGEMHATNSDRVDVGSALRTAFQATVEEDVPAEMLDLLRRLS